MCKDIYNGQRQRKSTDNSFSNFHFYWQLDLVSDPVKYFGHDELVTMATGSTNGCKKW